MRSARGGNAIISAARARVAHYIMSVMIVAAQMIKESATGRGECGPTCSASSEKRHHAGVSDMPDAPDTSASPALASLREKRGAGAVALEVSD